MSNEANYDRQLNNYKDEERIEPLPLRDESSKLDEFLRDWFTLTYGKKNLEVRDRIFAVRTKAYVDYENLPYFSFQRAMNGVRSRWARFLVSLKKSKPHSPINLEAKLHRVLKYLELGKEPRPKMWCPLTMQPPMLMWPLYDINTDRLDKLQEDHRREVWERMGGFYYTFKSSRKGRIEIGDFRSLTRNCNA